ncbi:MAG: DNA repair protein RadA [Acidimicrobiia bacterium]|nr:DNA repair protein RadA [Acidimicrobiia bacterium]
MVQGMKQKTVHRCEACGAEAPRWLGRCPGCGEWGSMISSQIIPSGLPRHLDPPVPIGEVATSASERRPTGIGELDRVLGGGLVPGSVTLLGGEPGMGKSTLLLQALGAMAAAGARCLLVGAEESPEQVRLRAERVGALEAGLLLVADTSLPEVLAHVEHTQPDVVAVDSIQAVTDPTLPGAPGSITQVRDCTHRLVSLAKARALPVLLVGHVTKEGTLAGPRTLEHVVDTVVSFDGDRHHTLRFLHALKHRFGSTQELGLMEMGEAGLVGVPDASALFLADRRSGTSGSAIAAVLDGARPLLVEVQALVAPSGGGPPRRSATGLDSARLALLLAVLEQRAGVPLTSTDVYASAAGGVRVTEPGADLAIALAVASAHLDQPLPATTVALGEVGLGGELRQVPQASRRLAEAARLGFTHVVGPPSLPNVPGLVTQAVPTLADALHAVFSEAAARAQAA